ncbi:MAG: polysaccharide deacetylase family protein, partial [Candidatus Methanoperedens sp.]|nr:polysaccharide deacetylase family protein [Candidatus Methanoperedens sp.]
GVDFVIIDPILGGWSDFTQRPQLNILYAAGWDISSHTYSHIALTTGNNTTLNYELAASRDWLNANGYPRGAMF